MYVEFLCSRSRYQSWAFFSRLFVGLKVGGGGTTFVVDWAAVRIGFSALSELG